MASEAAAATPPLPFFFLFRRQALSFFSTPIALRLSKENHFSTVIIMSFFVFHMRDTPPPPYFPTCHWWRVFDYTYYISSRYRFSRGWDITMRHTYRGADTRFASPPSMKDDDIDAMLMTWYFSLFFSSIRVLFSHYHCHVFFLQTFPSEYILKNAFSYFQPNKTLSLNNTHVDIHIDRSLKEPRRLPEETLFPAGDKHMA